MLSTGESFVGWDEFSKYKTDIEAGNLTLRSKLGIKVGDVGIGAPVRYYTNWDEKQPDNNTGDEYYLRMVSKDIPYNDWRAHTGRWDDTANEADGDSGDAPLSTFGFVCEWTQKDSVTDNAQEIPTDAGALNGHHYKIYDIDSITTWEDAEAYCISLGGYLAIISSEAENDFLYQMVVNARYTGAYFGITDSYSEGNWIWIDGTAPGYTNWHSSEPNAQNANEDYGMFYWKFTDRTWNDGDFRGSTLDGGTVFIGEWGQ